MYKTDNGATTKESISRKRKLVDQPTTTNISLERNKRSLKEPGRMEEFVEKTAITVEEITRTVCKAEEDTTFIKHLQINLLSHCIFCLRKTSTKQCNGTSTSGPVMNPKLKTVPRADLASCVSSSPLFLSIFNRTWSSLQKTKFSQQNNFIDRFLQSIRQNEDGKSTRLLDVPIMCRNCGAEMEKVYKLFTELKSQLDTLGRIVEESKYCGSHSWRADNFERTLINSNLEREVVDRTVSFLGKLGKNSDIVMNEPKCEVELQDDYMDDTEALSSDLTSQCPPPHLPSSFLQVVLEETPSEEPTASECSSRSTKSNDRELQFGLPSNYVQVSGASNAIGNSNFVDEDDEWIGSTTYVKLEPELNLNEYFEDEGNRSSPAMPTTVTTEVTNTPQQKLKMRQQLKETAPRFQFCDLCNKKILLTDIYQHVREHVGVEYLTACPNLECRHVYSNISSLLQHLQANGNLCRPYVPNIETAKFTICQVCGHLAASQQLLKSHLLEMHENQTKNFPCPILTCPQQFTVRQTVQLHLFQHDTPQNLREQNCPDCSLTVKLDQMVNHLKEYHRAEQMFKCSLCPFLSSTKNHLLDHLYEHRLSVLSCDICGDQVKFSEYSTFRQHYLSEHGIGGQYPCTECGVMSWTRPQWLQHLQEAHNGAHRTGAVEAGAATQKFVPGLEGIPKKGRPKKSEVDIKHECDLCGKSFARRHNLTIHKSTAHLGLRPHVCDICGETFAHKNVLQRHKLLHTGEKPFACDICGQRFSRKDFLKTHLDSHQKKGEDFSRPSNNGPMTRKQGDTSEPLQILGAADEAITKIKVEGQDQM